MIKFIGKAFLLCSLLSLVGCATQREWAAEKIRPVVGVSVDMIELNSTANDFAAIYKPFYQEVKAAQFGWTPAEKVTLTRAHDSLILGRGYLKSIHDSAANPREALVKIDQLEGLVEPIIQSIVDAKPIVEKKRSQLSVENQARLDSGVELFDQAAAQARSIAASEDSQEAQRRIKRLLTTGMFVIKVAALGRP